MGKRTELQELLETFAEHVYFQPPSTIRLQYPAIIYSRRRIDTNNADNNVYTECRSYTVTVIDKNPDSEIVDKITRLPMCTHDRFYVSDGLNHDVFVIYY